MVGFSCKIIFILMVLLLDIQRINSEYYCYNPQLQRHDSPRCVPPTLAWFATIKLCCGQDIVTDQNAVKIYDQNPEDNMQIEIQLPSNCKPGYFSVNLNRRFCPYRMMEVKSLQACCQGGEPRFQLEDMQRMAILNKDQLAIELNGLS